MVGYRLVDIPILISLTMSLSLLGYVSHPRAQDRANSVDVESICELQGNLALELSWSAQIALGSKMIFAANSLQDVATISAYPLDTSDPASGPQINSSNNNQDSTFYAIVKEYDDDAFWWELPIYQAYEISAHDASSILNHFDERTGKDTSDESMEAKCPIAFLGYGGASGLLHDGGAPMSEFVLIGDPQEQEPSQIGQ